MTSKKHNKIDPINPLSGFILPYLSYCMTKKSRLVLCRKLLYKIGQDFLYMKYRSMAYLLYTFGLSVWTKTSSVHLRHLLSSTISYKEYKLNQPVNIQNCCKYKDKMSINSAINGYKHTKRYTESYKRVDK